MKTPHFLKRVLLTFACLIGLMGWAVAADPLTEDDVLTLIKLRVKDGAIVSRVQEDGVSFPVDATTIDRLKKAGASAGVLAAIQKAADKKGGGEAAQAVTYQDVVRLLKLRVPEDEILRLLEKSPTHFTLGADQVAELRKLRASERLLGAMRERKAGGPAREVSDVAIILDCSGSMSEKTEDGKMKMDVAKQVVAEMVEQIPQGLHVAFIIYGHDEKLGCKAVKVVRPLSELDGAARASLMRFIATLQPVGHTPIALALEAAGGELARSDNHCGIILITDGMETCHGKPAEVAARLAQNPKLGFGVNVVGFGVKPEEKEAVKEIALKGKGEHYAPENTAELRAALDKLTREIEAPPKKGPGRRAIKVTAPAKLKSLALQSIEIYPKGGGGGPVWPAPVGTVKKYGEEFRLPSDEAYELWFKPKEGGAVRMVKEISIKERKVVEVRPDDYLGIVRVNGEDLPKLGSVWVAEPGTFASAVQSPVQTADRYGKDIVVPAGTYEVFVRPAQGQSQLIERKLVVKAGEVVVVD